MSSTLKKKIWAVIVAYHPAPLPLISLSDKLGQSGCLVVVVDNTEQPYLSRSYTGELVELGYNSGIAYAQNIGARMALDRDADIILFFDQDSSINETFVANLLGELRHEERLFVRCPVVIDSCDGEEYPSLRVTRLGLASKVYARGLGEAVRADVCISSGSAVAARVFDIVGFFNSDFFIDHVDTEWFMRCRRESVPVSIIPAAVLNHKIGSGRLKIGPIITTIHSHQRTYFQARNTISLLRSESVPTFFSIVQICSLIIHKCIQLPYAPDRKAHVSALVHGCIDGLLARRPSRF